MEGEGERRERGGRRGVDREKRHLQS